MTLTQLIEEAESDEDLGIGKILRRIKAHLLDLQEHLISRNQLLLYCQFLDFAILDYL